MKQIIQYQKTGKISIEKLPSPTLKSKGIIVKNIYSVISSGTEKTSVETAQASIIGKARSRPDLVRQVLDNMKKEGLLPTYEKVKNRLDNYKEMGYSSAGIVINSNCEEFSVGDRVACAGTGYASHAEEVFIPQNLAAKIPSSVNLDEAAFVTLGAIALQGVRQADPKLGENVVVIGLGLLGLITVQLLKANGCNVIGLDVDTSNFEIAKKLGCEFCFESNYDSLKNIESATNGYGTDAVLLTASTKSSEPIQLAMMMARKKSKVVVVGAIGMNVPRKDFYEKEIDIRIACSYGPGRYDYQYEEYGVDYPIGFVRWTENRNMQAILDLLSHRKISFSPLISHRFNIEDGIKAYDLITGKTKELYRGILLHYPENIKEKPASLNRIEIKGNININIHKIVNAGFIGAGNFAQSNLIPHLNLPEVQLKGVVTSDSINSKSVGDKFGFEFASTNYKTITENDSINTIFIATRHDSHSKYVMESIKNTKNVFVEKPLCLNYDELKTIIDLYNDSPKKSVLRVGFNRRFSKPFEEIKCFFQNSIEPLIINYRVNAGFIPKTHWIQDPLQGGRIIGEGCHFIDIMQFLTNSKPISVYAEKIESSNAQVNNFDNVVITIKFANGSIGNLLYLANGDNSVPKEYCEVYSSGKTAVMKDFKENVFYSNNRKITKRYDGKKGHKEEIIDFINAINGKADHKLTFESICLTSLTTFRVLESLQQKKIIEI